MSESSIQIKLKINFPVVLITVLIIHVLVMSFNSMQLDQVEQALSHRRKINPITIRQIKTNKVDNSVVKASQPVMDAAGSKAKSEVKPPVSLKDLALGGGPAMAPQVQRSGTPAPTVQRPGTRPTVAAKSAQAINEMSKVSLKSQEFRDYSKSFPSGGLAISDMLANTQKISDAVVSIEVPEGVKPEELNEYELMYYGFQKRVAMNYVNSILKNLEGFQKRHPNYRIPKAGRITMTARLTYDKEGNVQQIKMVRWTHIEELQSMFEDIVKNIDQLHNPPKSLWEKEGEFAMFYTLEILNG